MKGKEPNAKNVVAVDLMVSNNKYTEFYHRIVFLFFLKKQVFHTATFSCPKTWRISKLAECFPLKMTTNGVKLKCQKWGTA